MGFFSGCYVVDLVAVPDPVTGQGVFYDADSELKYSPVLGIQLRHNTIASRNTMCVYERMGPHQTGPQEPRLILR